jgi:hypothetical protein
MVAQTSLRNIGPPNVGPAQSSHVSFDQVIFAPLDSVLTDAERATGLHGPVCKTPPLAKLMREWDIVAIGVGDCDRGRANRVMLVPDTGRQPHRLSVRQPTENPPQLQKAA